MAPTDRHTLEWQTSEIIKCLFTDEEAFTCGYFDHGVETDGPADDFDPVQIAAKLRDVADSMNDDIAFKAALGEFKRAVALEAAEAAFTHGVETLCQSQVSQSTEVTPELQIIRASVAFGLYVKKSAPELKNKVQSIMTSFLNRRVGTWVAQQGGWDNVARGQQ